MASDYPFGKWFGGQKRDLAGRAPNKTADKTPGVQDGREPSGSMPVGGWDPIEDLPDAAAPAAQGISGDAAEPVADIDADIDVPLSAPKPTADPEPSVDMVEDLPASPAVRADSPSPAMPLVGANEAELDMEPHDVEPLTPAGPAEMASLNTAPGYALSLAEDETEAAQGPEAPVLPAGGSPGALDGGVADDLERNLPVAPQEGADNADIAPDPRTATDDMPQHERMLPMSSAQSLPPPPAAASGAPQRRVVHMHIPKTAGTALRSALERAPERKLRVFPNYDERQFLSANLSEWDVFSGHFGFKTASLLDGDIIAVLRHPVDRFVSVYYFWQELLEKKVEVTRKTKLTKLYSLDEFVHLHDELILLEEFFNRMTWQIAHGSTVEHRRELRDQGKTDNDVLAMASRNLESFALVGLQSNLPDFSRAVQQKLGVKLDVGRVNVTAKRPRVDELSVETRRRIYDWVYLDIELYEAATQIAGRLLRA